MGNVVKIYGLANLTPSGADGKSMSLLLQYQGPRSDDGVRTADREGDVYDHAPINPLNNTFGG